MKMAEFQLLSSRNIDLDLETGHMAYRHASLVDLYLHTKFHWNQENFLWTDGRTYVRTYVWTDGHRIPHAFNIIRSTPPNNVSVK